MKRPSYSNVHAFLLRGLAKSHQKVLAEACLAACLYIYEWHTLRNAYENCERPAWLAWLYDETGLSTPREVPGGTSDGERCNFYRTVRPWSEVAKAINRAARVK